MREMLARRNPETKSDPRSVLQAEAELANWPGLLGLLCECYVARAGAWGEWVEPLRKALGLPTRDEVKKQIKAEAKGAKATKPKAAAEVRAPAPGPELFTGRCRVCRCTEADCSACVDRTGQPCSWTSDKRNLCSACLPLLETDIGSLFVGRESLPQMLLAKTPGSVRTVGQALEMDIPKLKPADREDLRAGARAWLDRQVGQHDSEIADEVEGYEEEGE